MKKSSKTQRNCHRAQADERFSWNKVGWNKMFLSSTHRAHTLPFSGQFNTNNATSDGQSARWTPTNVKAIARPIVVTESVNVILISMQIDWAKSWHVKHAVWVISHWEIWLWKWKDSFCQQAIKETPKCELVKGPKQHVPEILRAWSKHWR